MTTRNVWKLVIVTISIMVCVAGYGYAIFAAARHGDAVAGALTDVLVDNVSGLARRTHPTEEIQQKIAFGATGWGSVGECSYLDLSRCIAFQVDSSIERNPALMLALTRELRNVCSVSTTTTEQAKHSESEYAARKPNNLNQANERLAIAAYFGCNSQPRERVRIQLNIVSGLAAGANAKPLPSGGVTYTGRNIKLLYQIAFVPGE